MEFTRIFTEYEEKLLEHDLVSIQEWIDDMINGKLSKCQGRAADEERKRLIAENATSIPASAVTLATNLFARVDYLNRTERDAAE